MSDDGLFDKYTVTRTDGRPVDWCFVLELDDQAARFALLGYLQVAIAQGRHTLANGLLDRLSGRYREHPEDWAGDAAFVDEHGAYLSMQVTRPMVGTVHVVRRSDAGG